MLFTDAVTVYNHYMENGEDRWHRTVLEGAMWSRRTELSTTTAKQTETKADSVTFDFAHHYGNDEYVEPNEFAKLVDKTGKWTLNAKDGQDLLCFGLGEEITPTFTLKMLRATHICVGTVVSVSDNRNRTCLKNIKVVVR